MNGEEYESKKYKDSLEESSSTLTKFGFLSGAGIGSLFFIMLGAYALGFWYGSRCILGADNCPKEFHPDDGYTAGAVMTIFFSLLMAGFNMNQLGPSLKSMTLGRQAAARIFPIIDREPEIRNSPNAIKPNQIVGKIEFQNVSFSYPK